MCQEDVGVRNLYYLTEFATELGLFKDLSVYKPLYVKNNLPENFIQHSKNETHMPSILDQKRGYSMGYDPLIKALKDNRKSTIVIEWENGLKVSGKLDTIFETYNGFEDDDENFIEYDSAIFRVGNILAEPYDVDNVIYNWLANHKGDLIEVSLYNDCPSILKLTTGVTIWKYH